MKLQTNRTTLYSMSHEKRFTVTTRHRSSVYISIEWFAFW